MFTTRLIKDTIGCKNRQKNIHVAGIMAAVGFLAIALPTQVMADSLWGFDNGSFGSGTDIILTTSTGAAYTGNTITNTVVSFFTDTGCTVPGTPPAATWTAGTTPFPIAASSSYHLFGTNLFAGANTGAAGATVQSISGVVTLSAVSHTSGTFACIPVTCNVGSTCTRTTPGSTPLVVT